MNLEQLQSLLDQHNLEVVIWLETHVTVTSTASKIFCSCPNRYNPQPNTDICPICTGQMGVLPMVNREVVIKALKLSRALHGTPSDVLMFDRKHYSYPDLPKGFQTTQLSQPISVGGYLDCYRDDESVVRIEIGHFHIEEDPAKLTHTKSATLIDYNRSGKPLLEIVTTPSIHRMADAITYMQQLQHTVRYVDISDADMEKGQFKSDVSISLRRRGSSDLNPRTEIKNMNSFVFAQDALCAEVQLQLDHWLEHSSFKTDQTTKWRDESKQELIVMRDKENIADYKFMTEPDIPAITITELIEQVAQWDIVIPFDLEQRLMSVWLSYLQAVFFSQDKRRADVLLALIHSDEDILPITKLLANLSGTAWYDGSIKTSVMSDLYDLHRSNEFVSPAMIQDMIDMLADDNAFDYRWYVRDNTQLDDILTAVIADLIAQHPDAQTGSLIGQLIKWWQVSKQFSRVALLQAIESLKEDSRDMISACPINENKNHWNKSSTNTWPQTYEYDDTIFSQIHRTHHHHELDETIVWQSVTVAWRIQSIRDHGDLLFIDLRAESEILQIELEVSRYENIKTIAAWNAESVICVTGTLIARREDDVNPHTRLGSIEVQADSVQLLSWAQHTPFQITQSHKVNESKRMEYRYLDLRNPVIADNLIARHKVTKYIRDYFNNQGFVHVDTPMLGTPSDEWSREFVVPSRLHPHQFYTLPQAPQQLKQILMWSWVDKYYQVARCFRDEDPKGDRQPEFTQIDLEMAYVRQDDITTLVGTLITSMVRDLYPHKTLLTPEIPHLDYDDVMERYSSDKPDLRYGLQMRTVTDLVTDCDFQVFTNIIKQGGIVKCMRVEWGQEMFTKKYLDTTLREFVTTMWGWGLANFHVGGEDNFIQEKLGSDIVESIIARVGAQPGDTLLFAANHEEIVHDVMSSVRIKIANDYKLYNPDDIYLLWVVNFPMFECTDTGEWKFTHNPFSMPHPDHIADHVAGQNISSIRAQQYDIVMNGNEIGGGSIRAHLPHLLEATYKIMGYSDDKIQASVWHMIEAFWYGFPPHGGLALGLERILMILQWHSTIREVIPFPKTGDAKDLLMKSPSTLSADALSNAHIKLD